MAALMACVEVLPVVWLPPTVTVPSRRIGSRLMPVISASGWGPFALRSVTSRSLVVP